MTQETIELQFCARLENLKLIDSLFERLAAIYSIPEPTVQDIILTAKEAAINAIKHGYNNDQNGLVTLSVGVNETSLEVRIEDNGKGFDLNKLPDPLQSENLLKPSGRGIFLIRELSDNAHIHSRKGKGTRVVIRKHYK